MANPRSTASIAGHPIHPMLIPFPIAFFIATFLCDLVYWQTANAIWATVAIWLLGAGIVMAVLAAIAGLIDVVGDAQIRGLNDAWWHAGGNVVVVLIQRSTTGMPGTRKERRRSCPRPDPVAHRGLHAGIYRVEGLGHGLPRSRRRGRCQRRSAPPRERIAAARGITQRGQHRAAHLALAELRLLRRL